LNYTRVEREIVPGILAAASSFSNHLPSHPWLVARRYSRLAY